MSACPPQRHESGHRGRSEKGPSRTSSLEASFPWLALPRLNEAELFYAFGSREPQFMSRILVYVLVGPPVGAVVFIGTSIFHDTSLLLRSSFFEFALWTIAFSYFFGIIPALVMSLAELALVKLGVMGAKRVALIAIGGFVLLGVVVPNLSSAPSHMPNPLMAYLVGGLLCGAVPAGVCAYLCMRNVDVPTAAS